MGQDGITDVSARQVRRYEQGGHPRNSGFLKYLFDLAGLLHQNGLLPELRGLFQRFPEELQDYPKDQLPKSLRDRTGGLRIIQGDVVLHVRDREFSIEGPGTERVGIKRWGRRNVDIYLPAGWIVVDELD